MTSDYDIGFGVHHVKEDGERVEVVRHIIEQTVLLLITITV